MPQPNKRLGQNFIRNEEVIDQLLDAADLSSQDTILEVGPGEGAITEKMSPKVKQIIAIEKDKILASDLQSKFKNQKNIKILQEDILKIDNYKLPITNYKIISNLPFYLTSHFLRTFLETKNRPTLMALLIQKEVAQRICDKPPKASLLSNSVQFYSEPKIISYVSRKNFFPIPKVDTAIIKIKTSDQPKVKTNNIEHFFKIMKIGFAQKRKQLHNNLSAGLHITNQQAKEYLQKSKIDPSKRAQELDLQEWALLASLIN